MIDRTTGNVLPTDFIRPNYPGRGAITQRVFVDEMYRNYNAIQMEVRRRLANGLAWAVNYTGSITKQYTAMTGSGPAGERGPEHAQERQQAAQSEVHLQLDAAGASRFMGNNIIAKGVFDGWQFSGITTMLGGTWSNFTYNFAGRLRT